MSAPVTTTNPLQTPPLSATNDNLKFFLANVGFTQTAPEIKSYIEQYFGPVNYVKLIPYRDPNAPAPASDAAPTKHKGYGFLFMMTEEGATALESYVNAFPGNKIRLIEREGVYVAKHDENRAALGSTSGNAGSLAVADSTGASYAYGGYQQHVDVNYAQQSQPVQGQPYVAAPVAPQQPQPVSYPLQQPQQGIYSNIPPQQQQVYAPAENQYAPVDYSQQPAMYGQQAVGYSQQPPALQNTGQYSTYQQHSSSQDQYNQNPGPPMQQPHYNQGPPIQNQYNQQTGPPMQQGYNQTPGPPMQQIQYNQQPGPLMQQQQGPPMQGQFVQPGPPPMQPMHHQPNYSNRNHNHQHYGPSGRFQEDGKFSRGGRGRGRGGGRNVGRPPIMRPVGNMNNVRPGGNMSNMGPMRGMPPPPPSRGGRGRGGGDGRSFRGGRGSGRNQRDMRRDRPY